MRASTKTPRPPRRAASIAGDSEPNPRYGETVTASAHSGDRSSSHAWAYACIVEPMSASENQRWFRSGWSAFWPDGPASADFAVFRCVPNRIEIWDLRRGITPPPWRMLLRCAG